MIKLSETLHPEGNIGQNICNVIWFDFSHTGMAGLGSKIRVGNRISFDVRGVYEKRSWCHGIVAQKLGGKVYCASDLT